MKFAWRKMKILKTRKPKIKKGEKGQALIEYVAILPMLFGLFFLALAFAVNFFAHALTAQLALEGGSREGISAGYGTSFSISALGQAAPTFGIEPSASVFDSGETGKKVLFTMEGEAPIPWAPFGLDLTAETKLSRRAAAGCSPPSPARRNG